MPSHKISVQCPVPSSFAVDQVRGMFDLAREKIAKQTFTVELPDVKEAWQIGVIVGPSGSGKSTVARAAYGAAFIDRLEWPRDRAVVDGFESDSIKTVTQTLTSVGFSSPPSWLKPHHVLSGGERFRCDLARALLMPGELVAFDEFTSVVDRTVAKIGSAAVSKSIRKGRIKKKFVAVTCHYDVLDWLEPDWVLDMASCQLARGSLYQRPRIELAVAPVHRSAWELFRRHHYLNSEISVGAKCFAAFWNEEPVAFSAWVHRMSKRRGRGDMREHRTVVLPDFQGIGIGNRMSEMCASIFKGVGGRAFSTTSHPGMIHYRHASPNWHTVRFGMVAKTGASGIQYGGRKPTPYEVNQLKTQAHGGRRPESAGRVTGGFQYIGPSMPRTHALAMIEGCSKARIFATDDTARILDALPSDGSLLSSRIIAARSGVPRNVVESQLAKLAQRGQVRREKLGRVSAFALP